MHREGTQFVNDRDTAISQLPNDILYKVQCLLQKLEGRIRNRSVNRNVKRHIENAVSSRYRVPVTITSHSRFNAPEAFPFGPITKSASAPNDLAYLCYDRLRPSE